MDVADRESHRRVALTESVRRCTVCTIMSKIKRKGAEEARKQYRELDPIAFGRVVRQKRVLDGRNALSRSSWEVAGWSYRALGRRAG